MADWKHEFITAGKLRFHCVEAGKGPLVLLLHGFPECWYSWQKQIPSLARHFRVVAPDLRGYHLTEKPPSVRDYSIDLLAEDVKNLILALGEEKAFVVGHDWGGGVAWHFAHTYPENLEKLAVLNCPHPAIMERHLLSNPFQIAKSWYMFFFQLPWLPEWLIHTFRHHFVKVFFPLISVNKEAFSKEDLQYYVQVWSRLRNITGGVNYYRAAFRSLINPPPLVHSQIDAPTLLLWGDRDVALGRELTEGTEKFCAGPYQVEHIPDSGHWLQQEKPDFVNERLADFFLS